MKRETYLTTERRPVASEADLLANLEADYRALLTEFPVRDKAWQMHAQSGNQTAREELALDLAVWNRSLVRELRDGIPVWRAMALGMAYMDRVMRFKLPQMRTAAGRIESGRREKTRTADDELTVRVLKYLRGEGMPREQALVALAEAVENLDEIDGVQIDHATRGTGFRFSRPRDGQPDQVEEFALSTIRKKWAKARRD